MLKPTDTFFLYTQLTRNFSHAMKLIYTAAHQSWVGVKNKNGIMGYVRDV